MSSISNSGAIEFARSAMNRSAAIVHRQMTQGLTSLATVTSVAPLVGVLGTLAGIVNSFSGLSGPRTDIMAHYGEDLSEALVPTALGLTVALVSNYFYQYLTGRVARFDGEMKNASLELANLLALYPMRSALVAGPSGPDFPLFRDDLGEKLLEDNRPWYRSTPAVAALLLMSWCIHIARYFNHYELDLASGVRTAATYVAFTFAVSWFVCYPLWFKVLRRSPGGLAASASLMCLSWSVAEFIVGRHLW
ncbi:MAG TPA: MotA/TolQ/ExbB proton channel family protein [Bryobacteraceae bacterium]|nr:MotA/TolQ/ExbB proton channel family protein [Bryobacteraceae bacterium]